MNRMNRMVRPDILLKRVQRNGLSLEHESIAYQTPEICLAAVKQNGLALQFVWNQTPKICLEAIKNGAFLYVREQTPEICMEAVKRSGIALRHVDYQTPELCLAAVKQNGLSLRFVKKQTPEICLAALKQTKQAYRDIRPKMRNHMATLRITDICLAMYPLRLPSYVLLEIIDLTLDDCTLTHWAKIHQVIRINELKKLILSQ